MDLADASLAELQQALAAGAVNSSALVRAYLARIEAYDRAGPRLNSVREINPDALAAAELDGRRPGKTRPLAGIPILVKDNIATADRQHTTAGSLALETARARRDATVVRRLRQAGAVILGKANLTEFANILAIDMPPGYSSLGGQVANPYAPALDDKGVPIVTPGGSSSGSAVAVAAGLAAAAIGTETSGSLLFPASQNGLVTVKPTVGLISRAGIVPIAHSQDTAGPLTRTVRDAAIMLGAMAGYDPRDSTSAPLPVPDYEAALTGGIAGLRIGIPKEYRADGMPAEIEALWRQGAAWLKERGAVIVDDVSLPHTRYALPAYYIIAPAEASSNLARYDGVRFGLRVPGESLEDLYEQTRAAGFGAEVRRRVLIGTYVLSAGYYDAYYLKAQRVRALIARDFTEAFARVDCLLAPTTPSAAFAIGEKSDDPIAMYLNDLFTVPADLAGLPAVSVPAGLSADGLPLGLQVIGRAFDEATVLRAAAALEAAAGFTHRPSFRAGDR